MCQFPVTPLDGIRSAYKVGALAHRTVAPRRMFYATRPFTPESVFLGVSLVVFYCSSVSRDSLVCATHTPSCGRICTTQSFKNHSNSCTDLIFLLHETCYYLFLTYTTIYFQMQRISDIMSRNYITYKYIIIREMLQNTKRTNQNIITKYSSTQ